MKQRIEQPKNSSISGNGNTLDREVARLIKMAEIIRAKLRQKLTLTTEEQRFYKEQQEENRRDDNPSHPFVN